jgi:MFS family permease
MAHVPCLSLSVGPLILSPLSGRQDSTGSFARSATDVRCAILEIPAIGRSPIYIITLFLFMILQIPTALVSNFAGFCILRFLWVDHLQSIRPR